jgi:hypothetical protein
VTIRINILNGAAQELFGNTPAASFWKQKFGDANVCLRFTGFLNDFRRVQHFKDGHPENISVLSLSMNAMTSK